MLAPRESPGVKVNAAGNGLECAACGTHLTGSWRDHRCAEYAAASHLTQDQYAGENNGTRGPSLPEVPGGQQVSQHRHGWQTWTGVVLTVVFSVTFLWWRVSEDLMLRALLFGAALFAGGGIWILLLDRLTFRLLAVEQRLNTYQGEFEDAPRGAMKALAAAYVVAFPALVVWLWSLPM